MTAYLDAPMLGFDTETTGIDVEQDRIVTACTAHLSPATPIWHQDITSHLIAVDVDIPEDATAVHGITTKFARDNGQPAVEVLDRVAGALADAMYARIPVVGSNLAYDFTILDRELRRHDLPTVEDRLGGPIRPVLDVYVLDKWLDRFRKGGRRLEDLCKHYGVLIAGAHDSTADALAAARVAFRMGLLARMDYAEVAAREDRPRYPAFDRLADGEVGFNFRGLRDMSLAELHEAQIGWRREQQESLARYFASQRKDVSDIDGHWPMRPYVTATDEAVLDA